MNKSKKTIYLQNNLDEYLEIPNTKLEILKPIILQPHAFLKIAEWDFNENEFIQSCIKDKYLIFADIKKAKKEIEKIRKEKKQQIKEKIELNKIKNDNNNQFNRQTFRISC